MYFLTWRWFHWKIIFTLMWPKSLEQSYLNLSKKNCIWKRVSKCSNQPKLLEILKFYFKATFLKSISQNRVFCYILIFFNGYGNYQKSVNAVKVILKRLTKFFVNLIFFSKSFTLPNVFLNQKATKLLLFLNVNILLIAPYLPVCFFNLKFKGY